jgi:3-methylcrotonyl-CoA carboxylase alpha subunit
MAETFVLRYGDRDYRVEVHDGRVVVDGENVERPRHTWSVSDGDIRWTFVNGEVYEFEVQRPGRRRSVAHHGSLTSPMPATVRKVVVEAGARVKKGDTLLVLEAMKMELPVRAPADGVVKKVGCREGDLVQPGVPLVEIE